jgi:DNA-binding MarR family transcriptional regulator
MRDEAGRIERECVAMRVRMLSRVVTGIYDEALSAAGLKLSQFTVLVALTNRSKTRPTELAGLLQMDESTVSRNVERMCAKGWLRLIAERDGRSHLIAITEKGMALVRTSYPAWQHAQDEVARRLGAESIAALRSVARKLRG